MGFAGICTERRRLPADASTLCITSLSPPPLPLLLHRRAASIGEQHLINGCGDGQQFPRSHQQRAVRNRQPGANTGFTYGREAPNHRFTPAYRGISLDSILQN